jgi:hypothetical protein
MRGSGQEANLKGFRTYVGRHHIALLALFFALCGTSAAAVNALPKNSVGPQQIRNNAVSSAKIKNGSLLSKDFKRGQLLRGPQGLKGDTGIQGLKGDKGDTGTVDTSNFYSKTQSDGRYAQTTSLGTSRLFSGLDFQTIISTTTWDTAAYLGKFETGGGVQYLYAPLNSLPAGAAIASVDFYVKNNVAGTTTVYLSQGTPSSGSEAYLYTAATSTVSATIQTLTLTPSSPVTFSPDHEGLLFWIPGAQNANDVIYGAKVNYTP